MPEREATGVPGSPGPLTPGHHPKCLCDSCCAALHAQHAGQVAGNPGYEGPPGSPHYAGPIGVNGDRCPHCGRRFDRGVRPWRCGACGSEVAMSESDRPGAATPGSPLTTEQRAAIDFLGGIKKLIEEGRGVDAINGILAYRSNAVAEEREACAALAERIYHEDSGPVRGLEEIHKAIRARGRC